MTHDLLHLYDFTIGLVTVAGLLYLTYLQQFVVGYRGFLYFLIVGFALFALGGPIIVVFAPDWLHVLHGLAALFLVLGLYSPVHNDLRKDQWAELLLQDPVEMRHPAEWMVPMDDEILELFHTMELVLTPSIIAHNLGRSREEVNRRLSRLQEAGLVSRVKRGKYTITDMGNRYLEGQLHQDLLEAEG